VAVVAWVQRPTKSKIQTKIFFISTMGLSCFRGQAQTKPTEAVRMLKQYEDLFRKKLSHLEGQQVQVTQEAKRYLAEGKRRTAKDCLKERAQKTKLMERVERYRETITTIRNELEQSILMETVVDGIKQSAGVLQQIRQRVDLDKVDNILESIRENVEHSNQVLERVGESGAELTEATIGPVDEEELERELAALTNTPAATPLRLPSAPKQEPIGDDEEEEHEFSRLSREMNQPLMS
jgi:division protein CdvB (Snf7/Vps24/ESCRT-III family)